MDRSLNPAYLQTEQLPFHSNASDWAVVHLHFTGTSDKYQYLHWEQPSIEKRLQVFLFGSQHLIVESALPVFLRLLLKLLVLSLEKPKLGREIPVLLLDNYIYTFLHSSKYTAVKFSEWIYKTQSRTFRWQHRHLPSTAARQPEPTAAVRRWRCLLSLPLERHLSRRVYWPSAPPGQREDRRGNYTAVSLRYGCMSAHTSQVTVYIPVCPDMAISYDNMWHMWSTEDWSSI